MRPSLRRRTAVSRSRRRRSRDGGDDVAVVVGVDAVLFVALAGEGGEAAFVFGEGVVVGGGRDGGSRCRFRRGGF